MKLNSAAVQIAAFITVWLIVAMAIGTEISPPFKAFLTSLLGQHWTAKSVISFIVFILLYAMFSGVKQSKNILFGTLAVVLSVLAGGVLIFGFFVWHFLYS